MLARVEAERVHELALRALAGATALPGLRPVVRWIQGPCDARLHVHALGLQFRSPLGLAAGFDKNGLAFDSLCALGFGFVEVGTITSLPQSGNSRPRVFRLPRDRALVNRMGFPNAGADTVAPRLASRPPTTIVGANIGKTKDVAADRVVEDYQASAAAVAPHVDYLVLNVSSPNTPGLREMQAPERLAVLITETRKAAHAASRVPVLVKISPDLSHTQIDAIADLALSLRLDGIVAVNTTARTDGLEDVRNAVSGGGRGGVSGAPLKARAVEVLERLHARVGDRVTLVSVGGIETPEDAWERILAGATLVQAYTGFVYGGPLWPRRMNKGLARLVRESGKESIQQVVGGRHRGVAGAGTFASLANSARDRPTRCEPADAGGQ